MDTSHGTTDSHGLIPSMVGKSQSWRLDADNIIKNEIWHTHLAISA